MESDSWYDYFVKVIKIKLLNGFLYQADLKESIDHFALPNNEEVNRNERW